MAFTSLYLEFACIDCSARCCFGSRRLGLEGGRWKARRRSRTVLRMVEREETGDGVGDDGVGGDVGDSGSAAGNPLFDMINRFKPSELVSRFQETSSTEVNSAFNATLQRLLGSMPSNSYSVQVRTIAGNLVSLMQTCTMTGYLMRNAQYRLSLTRNVNPNYNSLSSSTTDVSLKGGSAILTFPDGKIKEVSAAEYVAELRDQAQALREELQRLKKGGPAGSNELYQLIANLEPSNLQNLSEAAGPEVLGAIQMLIEGVLGVKTNAVNPLVPIETTKEELGQLLLYSMVSGYFLREAEVRYYMQDKLKLGGEVHIPALLRDGPTEEEEAQGDDAK